MDSGDYNLSSYRKYFDQNISATDDDTDGSKYYFSLMVFAVIAIFLYYLGSFLIVFIRYDFGVVSTSVTSHEISWRLAFENFPQLARNAYDSFFGYFIQYYELYKRTKNYLIPTDIGVKVLTICYFIFYWVPWDTKRCFRLGYFNNDYPYVDDEFKKKLEEKNKKNQDQPKAEPVQVEVKAAPPESINPGISLYPNYSLNPYMRAQMLKNQKPAISLKTTVPAVTEVKTIIEEDDEEEEGHGILPFDGVYKPLEEIYQKYEKNIYDFIRRRVLPGSNFLLVSYFSTLFIIDLAKPIFPLLYILGVMSMYWCMQSFLMVLDHTQFPHE